MNADGVLYGKWAVIVARNSQEEVTTLTHRLTHAGIEITYQVMKGIFSGKACGNMWNGVATRALYASKRRERVRIYAL